MQRSNSIFCLQIFLTSWYACSTSSKRSVWKFHSQVGLPFRGNLLASLAVWICPSHVVCASRKFYSQLTLLSFPCNSCPVRTQTRMQVSLYAFLANGTATAHDTAPRLSFHLCPHAEKHQDLFLFSHGMCIFEAESGTSSSPRPPLSGKLDLLVPSPTPQDPSPSLFTKVAVGVPCPWGDTAAYPTGLRGEKTAFLVEVTPL